MSCTCSQGYTFEKNVLHPYKGIVPVQVDILNREQSILSDPLIDWLKPDRHQARVAQATFILLSCL